MFGVGRADILQQHPSLFHVANITGRSGRQAVKVGEVPLGINYGLPRHAIGCLIKLHTHHGRTRTTNLSKIKVTCIMSALGIIELIEIQSQMQVN